MRALTRDPEKPEARALAEGGAEVVQGNLEDRSSIDRALEGVYGVFSVQNFFEAGYEANIEALRDIYPELATLESYLRSHGWEDAEPSTEG